MYTENRHTEAKLVAGRVNALVVSPGRENCKHTHTHTHSDNNNTENRENECKPKVHQCVCCKRFKRRSGANSPANERTNDDLETRVESRSHRKFASRRMSAASLFEREGESEQTSDEVNEEVCCLRQIVGANK